MFLNSLFNAVVLYPIVCRIIRINVSDRYLEVGSYQGSTPELVLFHGIFIFCLYLQAPSLNNAVYLYVISVSQVLIMMASPNQSIDSSMRKHATTNLYGRDQPQQLYSCVFQAQEQAIPRWSPIQIYTVAPRSFLTSSWV